MAQDIREPLSRDDDLDFSDDPLLGAAYSMSEWAITFVGPFFWICLLWLFLLAEAQN